MHKNTAQDNHWPSDAYVTSKLISGLFLFKLSARNHPKCELRIRKYYIDNIITQTCNEEQDLLSARCRTFNKTKPLQNLLATLKTTVQRDSVCTQPNCRGKKVSSTKAQACRCLAHGHCTWFPLPTVAAAVVSQGRVSWRNAVCSSSEILRWRRLLLLWCIIVQASCGATLARVTPDKRSVSLAVACGHF